MDLVIHGSVLGIGTSTDVNEVYNTVKEKMQDLYNLTVLEPLGFNNTYTLAVHKETAEKYNLETISDLCNVSNQLVFSPTLAFMEREDCWLGLQDTYPISFKEISPIDGSPRYTALINNECDVIDAYSTDGLLKKFDLVVLEDDLSFFLPYHAVTIINEMIVNDYPEVIELSNELQNYLNEDVMIDLNYQVDEEGKKPSEVARTFLIENSLISE